MSERGQRGQQPAQVAPVEQPMTGGAGEISQVALMPAHEYKAILQAKVFADADKIRTQETRPGGAFLVEGQWVDANGRPLKDSDIADLEKPKGVEVKTASDEEIERYDKTTPSLSNEAPEQLEEQRKGQEEATRRTREEQRKAQETK